GSGWVRRSPRGQGPPAGRGKGKGRGSPPAAPPVVPSTNKPPKGRELIGGRVVRFSFSPLTLNRFAVPVQWRSGPPGARPPARPERWAFPAGLVQYRDIPPGPRPGVAP